MNTTKKQRILPGLKPVLELLASSPRSISRLFCKDGIRDLRLIENACKKNGIKLIRSSQAELDSLCKDSHTSHQGIIAILSEQVYTPLSELLATAGLAPLPLILALDQIQDPGNLGTLARSAWALGSPGIILPEHFSASAGPAAFKASAGALALLPVCQVTNLGRALDTAEEQGLHIYGTANSEAASSVFETSWELPAVLVLGNENKGMRPGIAKRCHTLLRIPFCRPFDSLNIAQAGAIFLALCSRFYTLQLHET